MNVLQCASKWVIFLCSTVLFLSYLYNLCEFYELFTVHKLVHRFKHGHFCLTG